MDSEQVVLKAKRALLKAADDGKTQDILDIMGQLGKVKATQDLLRKTDIGKTMSKMRTHQSTEVSQKAKDIVKKWKLDVAGEMVPRPKPSPSPSQPSGNASSQASTPSSPKTPTETGPPRTVKTDEVTFKSTGNTPRDKTIELMYSAVGLGSYAGKKNAEPADVETCTKFNYHLSDSSLLLKRAIAIENTLFSEFKAIDAGYKQKARSLALNLKSKTNPSLRESVVSGELTVEKLCTMSVEEMASEDAKARDRKLAEEALFKARGAGSAQAETDMFMCGKCRTRKCTYFQMQTRSADEPMTTFVTCVTCGNHWKTMEDSAPLGRIARDNNRHRQDDQVHGRSQSTSHAMRGRTEKKMDHVPLQYKMRAPPGPQNTQVKWQDPSTNYSSDLTSEEDDLRERQTRRNYGNQGHNSNNNNNEDDDDDDDDVCIASLQRTTSTTMMRSHTVKSKPTQKPGLVRSLSASAKTMRPAREENEEPMPPVPTQEEEDLRLAMQRAWAVLESEENPSSSSSSSPAPPSSSTTASATVLAPSPPGERASDPDAPPRPVTIRIYIDDAKTYKTVQLTHLLTTAMVIQYLRRKSLLDGNDDWALFEIANSHGVERPLRNWEVVLDIVSSWEPDAGNALLAKRYSYHSSLIAESVLQKRYPPMHGWLSIEYKKGKWQKRFCYVKDNAIHHASDSKGSGSAILCYLATFDVYTLLQPTRSAPTSYVFALRSQDRPSVFEREEDYMRLLAVDEQENLKDWVLSIRNAKSAIHYQYHPHRVLNPLAPITAEGEATEERVWKTLTEHKSDHSGDEGQASLIALRRQKSTRELPKSSSAHNNGGEESTKSNHMLHRSESSRRVDDKRLNRSNTRGLSRSGTMRGRENEPTEPLIDCSEPVPFAKGSLLAHEDDVPAVPTKSHHHVEEETHHSNANTLIQLDDKVKFAKGSLLERKESTSGRQLSRSKSTREHHSTSKTLEANGNNANSGSSSSSSTTNPEPRRHTSLRRKPTNKERTRHHDVPLPNPPTPSNGPLLQLDGTPEQIHSRALLERQMKPLLNFADLQGRRR
ncbi:RNA polymerase II elongation factor [Apophysomyces ossiformis]|uniref:RNA polymerase II elongation factor n=1 Tax=Apophysomyces ossiformis TaxID=679940 RepID=A0A8H7BQL4_9FUNG|nr:RNA polymerase II elongation factor [Apophysomyces ossiformis]